MVVFIPFFVFLGMFSYISNKLRLDKTLLNPSHDSTFCFIFLFVLYLPWNIVMLIVLIIVCSIGSLGAVPVFIWPAIYYNVRRFNRTMDYWSGKARLNHKVLEEKIIKRPARYIPPVAPIRRPPLPPRFNQPAPAIPERHPYINCWGHFVNRPEDYRP